MCFFCFKVIPDTHQNPSGKKNTLKSYGMPTKLPFGSHRRVLPSTGCPRLDPKLVRCSLACTDKLPNFSWCANVSFLVEPKYCVLLGGLRDWEGSSLDRSSSALFYCHDGTASGSAWAQGPNDTEPMSGTRYPKAGNADVRVGERSRTSLALGGESS